MSRQTLNTDPNFPDPDAFYQALNDLYQDASDEQAERISARLILLLANHIGNPEVLAQAMAIAGAIKHDPDS
jgi:hypothetical protein